MFVKVVRKAPKESSHKYSSIILYHCDAVHLDFLDPDNPNTARVLVMPGGFEITVRYDKEGRPDTEVFSLNDAGQTVDRVV